jgi:hypothetical protein
MQRERMQRLFPLAFDLDVHLAHTPTRVDWAYLPFPENSLQMGRELQDPALDAGMIDRYAIISSRFRHLSG